MIAPINPPRTTSGVTMSASISPFEMAFATAVPTVNAAAKLKTAAQITAASGTQYASADDCRDRVRGIVKTVDEVENERDQYDRDDVVEHS